LGDNIVTAQLTEPSLLSDRALWLLDDLVGLVVNYDYFIDKQSYTFYKGIIEQWQDRGYYSDAMLYFWDDSPTEGLGDIEGQYFRNFLKSINELGFLLPLRDDALKVQTLFYIDKLFQENTIDTQTAAILDLWLGIDEHKTYYAHSFDEQFSTMNDNDLIKQLGYPEHIDTVKFYQAYQIVLSIAQIWQHQYLNDKKAIYQTLKWTGETVKQQTWNIQNQYETEILEATSVDVYHLAYRKTVYSRMKICLNWIKHFWNR